MYHSSIARPAWFPLGYKSIEFGWCPPWRHPVVTSKCTMGFQATDCHRWQSSGVSSCTWGTIYGQVFSVSFRVSRLQGLQPSGELGTNCTVREIVETLKWKLFHSRLDIIFSIPRAILEWSSLLNIEAPCIKEIRLQTNGEFGELQSLFACSQVKFTSALHDLCHG